MKQNGWYAIPLGISTQQEYENLKNPPPGCTVHGCTTIDVIGKIWWSPSTGRQYSLEHNGDSTIAPQDLKGQLESQGWANMLELFDGSFNCTNRGWTGQSDLLHIGFDGTLDTSCISQLPLLVPCGAPCPVALSDGGKCPFGNNRDCTFHNDGNAAVHGGMGTGSPQPSSPPPAGSGTIQPASGGQPAAGSHSNMNNGPQVGVQIH